MGPVGIGLSRVLLARMRVALIQAARARMTSAVRQRAAQQIEKKTIETLSDLHSALQEATREMGPEALRIARRLSSGPYSQAQLDKLGNPYARSHPRPVLPAYIINRQSGQFYAGWRREGRDKVVNISPHARYLFQGTRRMIARPILERIQEEVNRKRYSVVRAKIRAALQKAVLRKVFIPGFRR